MLRLLVAIGCAALGRGVLGQFTEPPPTTADPDTIKDCTFWHVAASGDTCESVSARYRITTAQLTSYNPSLAKGCVFVLGNSYCIEQNFGLPPPVTTTAPPTSTSNGVSTPTPTQTGMTKSCAKFHLVKSGDSCAAIGTTYGVSFASLYEWNPAIGDNCGFIIPGTYICVGLIGGGPTTTTTTPSQTTPPNGVVTPTPTQSGMVGNCNKFHLVKSGDSCGAIQSSYGIPSYAQLYAWNPALGNDCQFLVPGNYICVGLLSGTATTTTPSQTTPPNGVITPTPTQSGMVGNCNKFHLVKSGDSCGAIQSTYSIPNYAQLYSWNPALGNDCQFLIPGNHICVGTLGATTTTAPTTTSTTGNGISTPTPTQSGMVGNCNRFHLVKSGDSCGAIQSTYSIPNYAQLYSWNPALGNDCQFLIPGYHICVGVVGSQTTRPPTTTTRGNNVSTPTPTQPGMVGNCKTFHLVVRGDNCQVVADRYRISVANFISWNSGVGGSDCRLLQLGAYACVGLI